MLGRKAIFVVPALTLIVIGGALVRQHVADNHETFTTGLDRTSGAALDLARAIVATLLVLLIIFLVRWFIAAEHGLAVSPFENTVEANHTSGQAIADCLIAELQRVSRVHSTPPKEFDTYIAPGFRPGFVVPPRIAPQQETLSDDLKDVGSINLGDNKVPIGSLLLALKRLWPGGSPRAIIRGSVQKQGGATRLVAVMEHGQAYLGAQSDAHAHVRSRDTVKSWEVTKTAKNDNLLLLIRDIAYKIANDISPDSSAKTWRAFKCYTEALEKYHDYRTAGLKSHLNSSYIQCMKALELEPLYDAPVTLLYNIGVAYVNEQDYSAATKALEQAREQQFRIDLSDPRIGHNKDIIATIISASLIRLPLYLGYAYFQQGRFEEARSLDEQILGAQVKVRQITDRCNTLRRRIARPFRWLFMIAKSYTIPQLYGACYLDVFGHERRRDRPARCLDIYDELHARLGSDIAACNIDMAAYYYQKFDNESALKYVSFALEHDSDQPYAYIRRGYLHLRANNVNGAIADFERAIEIRPRTADFHVSLANAFRRKSPSIPLDQCKWRINIENARRLPMHNDYSRACLESVAGNATAALAHLSKAFDAGHQVPAWAEADADLDFIRDSVEFKQLLQEAKAVPCNRRR